MKNPLVDRIQFKNDYKLFVRFLKETHSYACYQEEFKATEKDFVRFMLRNFGDKESSYLSIASISNVSTIDNSFSWSETKEGHDYWGFLNYYYRVLFNYYSKFQYINNYRFNHDTMKANEFLKGYLEASQHYGRPKKVKHSLVGTALQAIYSLFKR